MLNYGESQPKSLLQEVSIHPSLVVDFKIGPSPSHHHAHGVCPSLHTCTPASGCYIVLLLQPPHSLPSPAVVLLKEQSCRYPACLGISEAERSQGYFHFLRLPIYYEKEEEEREGEDEKEKEKETMHKSQQSKLDCYL